MNRPDTIHVDVGRLKRKRVYLLVILLALLAFGLFGLSDHYLKTPDPEAHNANNQPTNDQPTNNNNNGTSNDHPDLVLPESPIGTVGMISAFIVGFGVFVLPKKR